MLFLQPVPYFLSENSHFYFCSNSGPRIQVPAFCSGKSSSEVADPMGLVCPCWMGTPRADLRAWPWMNPGVSQGLGELAAGPWPRTAHCFLEASRGTCLWAGLCNPTGSRADFSPERCARWGQRELGEVASGKSFRPCVSHPPRLPCLRDTLGGEGGVVGGPQPLPGRPGVC